MSDFLPPTQDDGRERDQMRWHMVVDRARQVARSTGYTGRIYVLLMQALDVYEEMFRLQRGSGDAENVARLGRAGPGRSSGPRPQPHDAAQGVNRNSPAASAAEERRVGERADRARRPAGGEAHRGQRTRKSPGQPWAMGQGPARGATAPGGKAST